MILPISYIKLYSSDAQQTTVFKCEGLKELKSFKESLDDILQYRDVRKKRQKMTGM